MNKIKQKYKNKKLLKVNEKNDIDSIIEIFQRFGKKYNVITTTLDPNIQYQTKETKITQTYTKTNQNTNINKMIKRLKAQGKITLIIIDNMKKNNNEQITSKIKKINSLENVKTKKIKENDIFKTLDLVFEGGVKWNIVTSIS